MGVHGYPWSRMDIHGYPYTKFARFCLKAIAFVGIVPYGYPWRRMDIHTYPLIYIHFSEKTNEIGNVTLV